MANRGGKNRKETEENDSSITHVQCDGLVSRIYGNYIHKIHEKHLKFHSK